MDEGSLEIVNAGEMYPRQAFVSDDGETDVPFTLLSGENPLFRGKSAESLLLITNYRLYHSDGPFINVPLGLVDCVECREIFYVYVFCKDGRSFRCSFENSEDSQKWMKRLQSCIKVAEKIEECFAFRFLSWSREEEKDGILSHSNLGTLLHSKDGLSIEDATAEAERMGFDLRSVWKVVPINENFKLCPSYPRHLIVPSIIQDSDLWDLAGYRYSCRIPAVVWRHQGNGCVIARSSQPRMGILSWRNEKDEKLIEAISSACSMDPGYRDQKEGFLRDIDSCGDERVRAPIQKKLLIIDARSYAAAMTNRAKGGGYECNGYYPNCEVQYMGLANIHTIRNSFNALRALCSQPDDLNWLSTLENSRWLVHVSGLLRSALVVVEALEVEERPVLVHCSDGWDRTPQIVALAEIMLDPHYRTKKGFQTLVEREWLRFGHKFADRCGHPGGTEDKTERSPVFLQWLDCVFQLQRQFTCYFEFNEHYLARLVLHTYSCLFGTFLCNAEESRCAHSVPLRTYSVWPILNEKSQFHNYLYNHSSEVLRPSFQIRSLEFWRDVYLPDTPAGNLSKCTSTAPPTEDSDESVGADEKLPGIAKTKSCEDLHRVITVQRRKSDTSLLGDLKPVMDASRTSDPAKTEESEEQTIANEPESVLKIESTCEEEDETRQNVETKMLGSTDTLVGLEPSRGDSKSRSVATDTSDLSSEDSQQSDVPSLPMWCQNVLGAYAGQNGITAAATTHKSCSSCCSSHHSRTPSSGFPATPCDDQSSCRNNHQLTHSESAEFDGMPIAPNLLQNRIKKLIRHYKNKVENLQMELSAARCEFLQHMCRQYQGKEFEDVVLDPVIARASPAGSESSWDLLWASNDPPSAL